MTTMSGTNTNREWAARLEAAMSELLQQVLRRGFYGSANLVVTVNDGTIQAIRRSVEQVER